ncbi:MAG: hypothetical protein ACRD9R_08315 [Pyrinomonadaceae bacterium]
MIKDHQSGFFGKQSGCPTSEVVSALARETLSGLVHEKIKSHVEQCDFCLAEVRLFSCHAPAEKKFKPVRMPLALWLMARQGLSKSLTLNASEQQRAA